MKTNSPNQVDGDVQALIEYCQRVLHGSNNGSQMEQVYKIALAALTAEPVYQFIANNPDKDGYIEWADCNPDYFSKEPTDMRRILYTAPPANLLRPVELPQPFAYTIEGMEEYIDGWWLRKDDVIEALRQQGYEVKND